MILDTNAVSALADGDEEIVDVLGVTERLFVPVIVIGEYEFGIAGSRHRSRYEEWFEAFLGTCQVLIVDRTTASHYGAIRQELKKVGTPIPSNDAWIAAMARQHAAPVVSRDGHFDVVTGIQRLTW